MGETLATTLTSLTSIFTSLMGLVAKVVETIISEPLLFIPFGISITYSVIKITKRLFR
uniref:Uncharacterized protein n=1 Tax=Dulem virus 59 TaxID=3145770 RepID=A0AAU8B7I9_9VIRU